MAKRMVDSVQRGPPVELTVNGLKVTACAGETLATILLAENITCFNVSAGGQFRAPYCNMGTCFECQVHVAHTQGEKHRWIRACMCPVEEGMNVITGSQLPVGIHGPAGD